MFEGMFLCSRLIEYFHVNDMSQVAEMEASRVSNGEGCESLPFVDSGTFFFHHLNEWRIDCWNTVRQSLSISQGCCNDSAYSIYVVTSNIKLFSRATVKNAAVTACLSECTIIGVTLPGQPVFICKVLVQCKQMMIFSSGNEHRQISPRKFSFKMGDCHPCLAS